MFLKIAAIIAICLGLILFVLIIFILLTRTFLCITSIINARKFKWMGKPNTWAIVTGATDGIGLEYAKQLFEKNYNILLISRNPQKLQKVREEIRKKHGFLRRIKTLVIDFTENTDEMYKKIELELASLENIDILVNNVSIIYPGERPYHFHKIPNLNKFIADLINANIFACTRLTSMVLPRMFENKRGVIINISSFSCLVPTPYLVLYSSSKAYMDFFSQALQKEYSSQGIIIQTIIPYYVSTKMAHNKKPSFFVPTAKSYVRSALASVGRNHRTNAYFSHKLYYFAVCFLNVMTLLTDFNWSSLILSKRLGSSMKHIDKKVIEIV